MRGGGRVYVMVCIRESPDGGGGESSLDEVPGVLFGHARCPGDV